MNPTTAVFTAASHADVLTLLLQIAILLFAARLFGEIAQRLGQPSVVGELLAGIVLGPSCLGKIIPILGRIVIPQNPVQGYLLETISLLGALFLLLITGLETDLHLIRRHAKTALGVAAGGLLLPFVTGFFLGQHLPEYLLANAADRVIFALFMATAMSISAIPVLAKILMDLKLTRRNIGQTMIAAGMIDDTTGWILLSIVAALASGKIVNAGTLLHSAGNVLIFMTLSFTAGRWLVKNLVNFVQDKITSPHRLLTLVVVLTFTWAAISHSLRLEPILGAFVIGILLGQLPQLPESLHRRLQGIAIGIFAPIFFAVAGLKVTILPLFLNPDLFKITLIVILVASFGKIAGTYLGARLIGRSDHWTALSFGAALNARGAMEIIVASIGLSLGILTQAMFSIIVVMAMTTSLAAPILLRWVIKHIKPDEEEIKRLQQEELSEGSPAKNIHRILVPIRNRESEKRADKVQLIKSKIIQRLGQKTKLSLTLLSVDKPQRKSSNLTFLDELGNLFPKQELSKKFVGSLHVVDTVLDEAQKFYDLLILGASQSNKKEDYLFSDVVDPLVSLSPCPTMIVHVNQVSDNWKPKRIMVPTNGSFAAKRAAEVAFMLPAHADEEVLIYNVIERDSQAWRYDVHSDAFQRQIKIAEKMVEELKELGELHGVRTSAHIEIGSDPETVILNYVKKNNIDLIILGTAIRPASTRLFLGPRVERILKNASCPVVILNWA